MSDFTCKIIEILNFFHNKFNNNENKVSSLAYWYRNGLAVLNKFDANGVYIFKFKKHAFADRVFSLMLIENNPCRCKNFFRYCNIY